MITTLINSPDNFERIRDQIVQLLADEVANQMTLATAAGQDPELWRFRVYAERFNIWEQWLNQSDDAVPIVNVWFDNSSFDEASSNISERQKATATFNIDCYGFAVAREDSSGGFIAADEQSARNLQRVVRLVRNILMAAGNTYLGFPRKNSFLWKRWIQSITEYQPQLDDRAIQQVTAARIAFNVMFNEFSPQAQPVDLEELSVTLNRAEDGRVLALCEYDYRSS